jgi:DNA-binding LacI/PurR family transcriptional regulator
MFNGDFSFESGLAATEAVLRAVPRVTAVWAQNDLMAAGLLKGMARAGVWVPEDVSIMGMDDLLVPEMVSPSLTTIAQPVSEMARRAVEMILNAKDKMQITRRVLVKPRLVIRESTAQVKIG